MPSFEASVPGNSSGGSAKDFRLERLFFRLARCFFLGVWMPDAAAFGGFDDAEGAEGEPREEGSRMVKGLVGMAESSALALFFSYLETTE